MRAWWAVMLAGCSSEALVAPKNDAGSPDANDDDAAIAIDARAPDATSGRASGILVDGPLLLSQTGLYSDFASRTIAPGNIAFAPRWPSWADGATKKQWIHIPERRTIDTSDMNQWTFPVGTKLWQEITYGKTVETRFLWKQGSGWANWWMGAYVWRNDGSDADFAEAGARNLLGTGRDAPSQETCVLCHYGVADVVAGFAAMQLSAPQDSQLARFSKMGWLSKPPTREYEPPGTGVTRDALVQLHAECSNCHNESSLLYLKQTKLQFQLRVEDVKPEDTGPYEAIGMVMKHQSAIYGAYGIEKGRPELSQVLIRMSVRDDGQWQMPPWDTKTIEVSDVKAVSDWILSLK